MLVGLHIHVDTKVLVSPKIRSLEDQVARDCCCDTLSSTR